VLIIDALDERRRALAAGLSGLGYETALAASSAEGLRFARGLGPSVLVGAAELEGIGDGSILERFSVQDPARMRRSLLILQPEAPTGSDEGASDLPDDALALPIGGLGFGEILRRIQMVLIGRELGLDADLELRYLVGDVELFPLVDLARALTRAGVSARVEVGGGTLGIAGGRVVAAQVGKAEGAKAFCRLARRATGPFRVSLEPVASSAQPVGDVDALAMWALEESHAEFPDLRARLRMVATRDLPSGEHSPTERLLAQAVDRSQNVGELLDAIQMPDFLIVQALQKMIVRGALRLERPKQAVKVITDSTADLPAELARVHDILTVPLSVIFGKERYRDGVEIHARDFYQLLRSNEAHPTTQPPTEGEFYEHFHDLIVEQDLIAVHISGKLSLTAEHARQAALRGIRSFDHLPPSRHNFALEVVDSRSVSMGVGLLALCAARMAARQERVFAIAQRLRTMAPRIHLLFGVDTLDFLQRGGRIGKAQAWVGKLLAIKPILGVVDGEVVPLDRVRGGRRVHPRMIELMKERIDPKKPLIVAIAHAQAPVWADRLRKLMEKSFQIRELILTDVGPVVGTHAGPGCVGTVFFQPTEEEWPLIEPLP
jgi:DegV family protein with EDD domain